MKELLQALTPGDPDRLLANQIDPKRLPSHIAIIMDGNGRWASSAISRGSRPSAGIEPVRTTVETCAQLGIKALTLYAFSVENWKRPRHEVETLWRLLRYYLQRELANAAWRTTSACSAIGRVGIARRTSAAGIADVDGETSRNTGMRLNLAINYGGRAEIVDAVNALIDNARLEGTLDSLEVDRRSASPRISIPPALPDPDLLIRTSGEMRVSNFLLWQIAYAELYVTETLWPDFERTNLLEAILDYQKRERRFGGVMRPSGPPVEDVDLLLEELELPSR